MLLKNKWNKGYLFLIEYKKILFPEKSHPSIYADLQVNHYFRFFIISIYSILQFWLITSIGLTCFSTLTIIGDSPFFKTLNLLQITEIVASINLG